MAYLGKTPSQAVRSRYFYTAAGGETSLSGADDNNDTLIFADGNYVDVYLNGVLLVAGSDYNVNTANTISGLTALVASDIVEIVVYDTFAVFGGTFQGALTADSINADIFGSHQFEAKNVEGSTILKGTPVYISGHSGNDPEIGIADANDAAKMPAFGIAITDIANNNKGNVIVFGNYIGLDTSGFTVGDELYVSNTGTLTATRPSGSADKVQKIAKVIRSQSQNGQIFVMGAGRSNDTPNAITTNSINLSSTTTVSGVLDEDTMTSNSATSLATQQSIKAYVDSQIGANNELSEVLSNGNTTGGTDISFGDNDKAVFGAGSDLQIYHDASDSYIVDGGTGNLRIQGEDIYLMNAAGTEVKIRADDDSFVKLYFDNAEKLATTSSGVDVTGNATFDDNGKAIFGAGSDGSIYSDGTNLIVEGQNADSEVRLLSDDRVIIGSKGWGESFAIFNDDGESSLYFDGTKRLATTSTGVDVTGTVTADGLTVDGTGGQITTDNNGFITSKQSLDVATAGGRFIGKSNRGELGQIAIEQTATGADGGYIRFNTSPSGSTSPTQRMRITEAGTVLVGVANLLAGGSAYLNEGITLNPSSDTVFNRNGGSVVDFSRQTSDGQIVRFVKDNSVVGSIGAKFSGRSYIASGSSSNTGVRFDTNFIAPADATGANRDNAINLGSSGDRFKDLYLSGGVYLGGTGSANHLDDYEEGTFTPTASSWMSGGNYYGSYIKVGDLVHISIYISGATVFSSAGIYIGNLPFTVASGSESFAALSVGHGTSLPNCNMGYAAPTTTRIDLIENGTNTYATESVGTNKTLMVGGAYRAA